MSQTDSGLSAALNNSSGVTRTFPLPASSFNTQMPLHTPTSSPHSSWRVWPPGTDSQISQWYPLPDKEHYYCPPLATIWDYWVCFMLKSSPFRHYISIGYLAHKPALVMDFCPSQQTSSTFWHSLLPLVTFFQMTWKYHIYDSSSFQCCLDLEQTLLVPSHVFQVFDSVLVSWYPNCYNKLPQVVA